MPKILLNISVLPLPTKPNKPTISPLFIVKFTFFTPEYVLMFDNSKILLSKILSFFLFGKAISSLVPSIASTILDFVSF